MYFHTIQVYFVLKIVNFVIQNSQNDEMNMIFFCLFQNLQKRKANVKVAH